MAIKRQIKISTEFSMASMSDMVFLLLIFFMISSTLISPNAIKVLLPSSTSTNTVKPKQSTTVYINDKYETFVNKVPVADNASLPTMIANQLIGQESAVIVLRSDKTVPVQYVVTVIDAVNKVNDMLHTKHRVILATKAIEQSENRLH